MKSNYSMSNDVMPLARLALPLALTGLIQSATWFFETIFLAHVSEETLAAGALVSWLFATLLVVLLGTLSSINILVARKHGAKDDEGIARIARDGILLAMLLVIPFLFLFWNMSPIFYFFGQSEAVVALARLYLHALSWGLLANFIALACLEVILGIGHARVIFWFSAFEVLLNVVCSYTLIFGKFGFPAMGIAGAGWGLTVSYTGTLIALSVYIATSKKYRHYFRHVLTFVKPTYLLELFQVGLPMGVMFSVEVAFFFALTLAMGVLGTKTQAANQVAVQYLGLMMSMIFAMAQAITVRMGHLIGAQDVNAAEKAGDIGILMSVGFMFIIAIIYWLCSSKMIGVAFDLNNPDNASVINELRKFLAITAVFQIVESARISLFGVLRSLKDTRFTLLTSIISFWGIALPIGYLLAAKLQFGGGGYWWAMVIGASVSVVMLRWRFKKQISAFYHAESV